MGKNSRSYWILTVPLVISSLPISYLYTPLNQFSATCPIHCAFKITGQEGEDAFRGPKRYFLYVVNGVKFMYVVIRYWEIWDLWITGEIVYYPQNILVLLSPPPRPVPVGFYEEGQISVYTHSHVVPHERNPNIMTLGAYIGKLAHLPFLTSTERKTFIL